MSAVLSVKSPTRRSLVEGTHSILEHMNEVWVQRIDAKMATEWSAYQMSCPRSHQTSGLAPQEPQLET